MAFPAVLQTAQTECGLGVSASILQHYGRYQTVSDLRLAMEPGREGLNLLQVSNLLTDEGMEVGAYRASSLEQLRDLGKPVILHWNNSHYVVLVRMRHDRVQIMDPGQGLRTISLEEAESSFSGSVLVPTPRDDFEKKSRNVFKDWQFHTFFTKQMFGQYALFILLLAITYSVTFAVPMVIQHVVDALRSHIGYVPQQLQTRTGSLYDNLTAGLDDGRSREEIEASIYAMGILDFVKDLPLGFDTIMANGGENFSGGQRQRIAIATALLRYPRILVLDEATSALDTTTERQVTELIAQYQCTKVVVAHRLSTVRNAENIVVMEDGRIIQSGRHDDLMMVEGRYRELYSQEEQSSQAGYIWAQWPPTKVSRHGFGLGMFTS